LSFIKLIGQIVRRPFASSKPAQDRTAQKTGPFFTHAEKIVFQRIAPAVAERIFGVVPLSSAAATASLWIQSKDQDLPDWYSPFETAYLEIPGQGGFLINLGDNPFLVGRNQETHFSIRKRRLSGGSFVHEIMDHKSAQGTRVDGGLLEAGVWYGLRSGSQITAGETSFVFREPDQPFPMWAQELIYQFAAVLKTMKERKEKAEAESAAALERLLEALGTADWAEVLRTLSTLPDIRVMPTNLDMTVYTTPHGHHEGYPLLIHHLGDLMTRRLDEGIDLPMTWAELTSLRAKALSRAPSPPKEEKLPDDLLASLRHLLEHPVYRPLDLNAGQDALFISLEEDHQNLIQRLTAALHPPGEGPLREAALVLRKYGFDDSGRKMQFPLAASFFERHFPGRYFNQNAPFEMLEKLIFPDLLREETKKDPVLLPGYGEAVRELGEGLLRLKRGGSLKEHLRSWFFDDVPRLGIPERLREELERLIHSPGFEDRIEEFIARKGEDSPLSRKEVERAVSSGPSAVQGTVQYLYSRQIKGGARLSESLSPGTKLVFPKEAQNGNGHWMYAGFGFEREREPLGRFYFAVKAEHAADFWEEMKQLVERVGKNDRTFQAKISLKKERYSAGDAAVLYFEKKDQLYFHVQALRFFEEHPEWFHDTRPIFAARVKDLKGNFVRGLSFGQDPGIPGESFNGMRADALRDAVRLARFWRIMGAVIPAEGLMRLIAVSLKRYGVDLHHPAFDQGRHGIRPGITLFGEILHYTDQI